MTEQTREKREEAWNRYLARKAVHLARERRDGTPVGTGSGPRERNDRSDG
jgi:hypothetical protein